MSLGNAQMSSSEQRKREASMSIKESTKPIARKTSLRCQDKVDTAISDALKNARQYREDATEGDITVKVLPIRPEVQDILHILRLLWYHSYSTGTKRITEIQRQIKLLRELEAFGIVIEDSWLWYCIPSEVKRILGKSSTLPKVYLPEMPQDVKHSHVKFARAAAKTMFKAGFWEEDVFTVLRVWSFRCANSSTLKLDDLDNAVSDMRPWAKYWRVYAGYTLEDLKENSGFTVFRRMHL